MADYTLTAHYQWDELMDDLNQYIRIVQRPVGLQFCETKEECDQIAKVRLTEKRHAACQLIGQSIYNGWTIGIQHGNYHADYCRAIHGMAEVDEKFQSGKMFENIWNDPVAAKEHHCALNVAKRQYEMIVVSPLRAKRLKRVDVCLLYGTSGQIFMLLSGFLYSDYKKLDFSFSGESSCNDSWIRTLNTGKPSVGIPSFAERKFGGVSDTEIALTITPKDLKKAIEGVKQLHKNGLRYPIAPYSISTDIMAGLPEHYSKF